MNCNLTHLTFQLNMKENCLNNSLKIIFVLIAFFGSRYYFQSSNNEPQMSQQDIERIYSNPKSPFYNGSK